MEDNRINLSSSRTTIQRNTLIEQSHTDQESKMYDWIGIDIMLGFFFESPERVAQGLGDIFLL